jgi:hypothetical protein
MHGAPFAARVALRLTFLIQLVLGLIIWTGQFDALIPIHVLDGVLFVLALLAMAYFGARAGVPGGLVGMTVVWAILVPAIGLIQVPLINAGTPLALQLVHLIVGVAAMGTAEAVGRRMTAAQEPASSS